MSVFDFYKRKRHRFKIFCEALKYYIYNKYLTNFPSYGIRLGYLRNILHIPIGKDSSVLMGCFFAGNNIVIGSNTVIARNCYFDGRAGLINIGSNVSIAPEAYIITMSHLVNSPDFDCFVKPVFIEDYVWIGARVMILPGVTASEGCVLAAASVVTKNVEPYTVVAGSPAKKIGERSKELKYKLNYFPLLDSDIQ
jgi:acetyltransferase-like isoleucine patch superfamily enzyme